MKFAIITRGAEYADDPYFRDHDGNILLFPSEEAAARYVCGRADEPNPFDCDPLRLGEVEIVEWNEESRHLGWPSENQNRWKGR